MYGKQLGFSDYKLTKTKKQAKREKFLSEMPPLPGKLTPLHPDHFFH